LTARRSSDLSKRLTGLLRNGSSLVFKDEQRQIDRSQGRLTLAKNQQFVRAFFLPRRAFPQRRYAPWLALDR